MLHCRIRMHAGPACLTQTSRLCLLEAHSSTQPRPACIVGYRCDARIRTGISATSNQICLRNPFHSLRRACRTGCRHGSDVGVITCRAPVPDNTYKSKNTSIEAPSGVGSDDGSSENAPALGASRYSAATSLLTYMAITMCAGLAAWTLHPALIDLAADIFKLNFKESAVGPLQNSFFSVLSLLFSFVSGNTMAFLYNRQRELVAQFYEEINILEEVMEQAVYALGDEAYSILTQVRKYIDQELRSDVNQLPPLEDGLALNIIRTEARRYRDAGADVSGVMAATLRLAQSQNTRQAAALQTLPFVHWALLYIIAGTFVLTLVLLEPGGSFSQEGRRLLFTVLCSLMTFVLMVISDLADASEGVYSSASAVEERLQFTGRMLERHQKLPVIPEPGTGMANRETNAYLNRRPPGVAVTTDDVEGKRSREIGGLASLSVRQPKLKPPPAPKLSKRQQLPDMYGSTPRPNGMKPNIRWSDGDAKAEFKTDSGSNSL